MLKAYANVRSALVSRKSNMYGYEQNVWYVYLADESVAQLGYTLSYIP